jgi:hypothetical protein
MLKENKPLCKTYTERRKTNDDVIFSRVYLTEILLGKGEKSNKQTKKKPKKYSLSKQQTLR